MGAFPTSISPADLAGLVGSNRCPIIVDVRRRQAYAEADRIIPTAVWREPGSVDTWAAALPPEADLVVYCVHGHQVGQSVAAFLRANGRRASFLTGGIEAFSTSGNPTILKSVLPGRQDDRPSRWVTRERPKIDRIACPWFIRRFVDRDAAVLFAAAEWVEAAGAELGAVPFDIPGVDFSHDGERCSFDAFLRRFGIEDAALDRLARIVRGADTGRLDLEPQCAGLLAASLGLSASCPDDREMLERGMTLYDALYAWCRSAADETHGWPPKA